MVIPFNEENFVQEIDELIRQLNREGVFSISRDMVQDGQHLINHYIYLSGRDSYAILVFDDDVFMLKADGKSKYRRGVDNFVQEWELFNGTQLLKIVSL